MAPPALHDGHRPRLTYADFTSHARRYRRTLSPRTPRAPICEGIRAATVASARAACDGVRSECAAATALRACGAGPNALLGPRAGWCGLHRSRRHSRSEPRADGCADTRGSRFVNLWFVYDVLKFNLAAWLVWATVIHQSRVPDARAGVRLRDLAAHTDDTKSALAALRLLWDRHSYVGTTYSYRKFYE